MRLILDSRNSDSKVSRSKNSGKKAIFMAFGAISLFGLPACNNSEQAVRQVETDWEHDDQPSPTPTSTATPAPTPTATSTPPSGSALYTGPADVEKYVVKFVEDAKRQGVDVLPDMSNPKLEIQIASLDSRGSSVIGLCETGYGKRRVTFDPDFWNSVSETQRELLAHHELGHCVLYRGHRSSTLSSGAYASIMYPIIMSTATYQGNYEYYQNELFTYGANQAVGGPEMVTTHICDHADVVGEGSPNLAE